MIINKRQAGMMIFTLTTAGKFLLLPSVYAQFARQDACVAGLTNLVADGAMLAAVLAFIKISDGRSFYDLLENSFGKFFANAVYLTFSAYFTLKAIVPIFEHKKFIEISFYEAAPPVATFVPLFFLAFYFAVKGMKTFTRASEILFRLTLAGTILAVALSIFQADFFNLLPVMKNPPKQTFYAGYMGLLWHGQPLALLFLAGRIKKEKGFYLRVALSFAAAAALCVLLLAVFTGIYGDLAPRETYAINKMTKYSLFSSTVMRFDYAVTILITAGSLIALAAPLVFATDCAIKVFGNKRVWLIALVPCGALCAMTLFMPLYFRAIIEIFEKFFTPAMAFFAYAVPPLALLLTKKGKRRKEKIYETAYQK
ncbi:MAG: GerAB/ArcD/ProY family transporter [Clostridia bacterium]|nr:GerAB/ArcD/ProY family transporter [Clostridia bacterium]